MMKCVSALPLQMAWSFEGGRVELPHRKEAVEMVGWMDGWMVSRFTAMYPFSDASLGLGGSSLSRDI